MYDIYIGELKLRFFVFTPPAAAVNQLYKKKVPLMTQILKCKSLPLPKIFFVLFPIPRYVTPHDVRAGSVPTPLLSVLSSTCRSPIDYRNYT